MYIYLTNTDLRRVYFHHIQISNHSRILVQLVISTDFCSHLFITFDNQSQSIPLECLKWCLHLLLSHKFHSESLMVPISLLALSMLSCNISSGTTKLGEAVFHFLRLMDGMFLPIHDISALLLYQLKGGKIHIFTV